MHPQSTQILLHQPFTIHAGDTELPISIPIPPHPGTWQVVFEIATNPEIHLAAYGMEQFLKTYPPAAIEPGSPYTIAVIPDTQSYTINYPEVFMRKTQWLAESAQRLNLGLVLHVGDITKNNTPVQWQRAAKAMHLLDGVVPYVLTIGACHDFSSSRDDTLFNSYFTIENAMKNSQLAGVFRDRKLEDSYSLVTLGDQKCLVIALNSGPSDAAVAWANSLAEVYKDHTIILVTHMMLTKQGTFMTEADTDQWPPTAYYFSRRPGESVNTGKQLWEKLLSKHPNMLMAWCGHVGVSAVTRRVEIGDHGNPVFSLMADYQNAPHGGDGWVVLMTFNPDQTVDVRVFSPYLNAYKYDVDRFGFNTRFTIDLATGLYRHAQENSIVDTLKADMNDGR